MQLDLGLARTYSFELIIADEPFNIIGADFLTYFNLIIKLHLKELYDPYLNTAVKSISQISKFSNVSLVVPTNKFNDLLEKFHQYNIGSERRADNLVVQSLR